MIPILFPPKTREYNNNGLGVLVDVGYCTVTEERNGIFELELQYPINGIHYSDLSVDCQILAKPNETSSPQAFRIYNISKPMSGVVTVRAEHISYELSSVIVSPFSATSAVDALSKIKSNSMTENVFTFWTDKNTVAKMTNTVPSSARSLLGGISGSVLDVYTGEYEFDNYTVKLHQNRGHDNGVVIAYSKNLTGVKCDEKSDGIVTGALAVWVVNDENGQVINKVYGDLQTVETNLSYSRNVVIDCSSDFDVEPTKEALNDKARRYIESHKNTPYFSVSVEFVNLGDAEEYKQYKGLYRVNLCDTVTVRHPLYGIDVKAKVVKTVFDSVNEKYEKIEIGEISANISQTIAAQEKEIENKVGFSDLDKAVANATSAIAGNKGGYVVLHPNAINPQELLILDKPNINEAVNVWRWNLGGLGHSSSGYSGNFTTAITADGQIVADFITTGTLNASIIKAGVLSSKTGFSSFSLDTGDLQIGGNQYYTKISSGAITQFLEGLGGNVGGIVPAGSLEDDKIFQTLYYDSMNSKSKGVSIAYNENGELKSIADFTKTQTKIYTNLICEKSYKIGDYSAISINDLGYMVFGSSAWGTTSVWGKSVVITTSDGLVKISSPQSSVEVSAKNFVNINATNVCIGCEYIFVNGYKNYIDGNTIVNGKLDVNNNVYCYGDVSGATITNRSDRKIKKNIQKTKTKNALTSISSMNVYDYDLKDGGESVKMGLMADEAPLEILSSDGEGINLYSYCGMLALAIKELSEKVDNLGGNHGRKD